MRNKINLIDEFEDEDYEEENVALITDSTHFGELSTMDEEALRESIAVMNKKINLQLEGEKLMQAKIVFDDLIDDIKRASSPELKDRIMKNMKSGMDYKFFLEANEKKWKMLQNLLRVDSQNSTGSPSQMKIGIQYADNKGNTTSVMIQTGGD